MASEPHPDDTDRIFHICARGEWDHSLAAGGPYTAPSLATEGFIHCSTATQLVATVGRYYAGVDAVVVLAIDATAVEPHLRWEHAPTADTLFPHLYAPLPLDAVRSVIDFPRRPNGCFDLPSKIATPS